MVQNAINDCELDEIDLFKSLSVPKQCQVSAASETFQMCIHLSRAFYHQSVALKTSLFQVLRANKKRAGELITLLRAAAGDAARSCSQHKKQSPLHFISGSVSGSEMLLQKRPRLECAESFFLFAARRVMDCLGRCGAEWERGGRGW